MILQRLSLMQSEDDNHTRLDSPSRSCCVYIYYVLFFHNLSLEWDIPHCYLFGTRGESPHYVHAVWKNRHFSYLWLQSAKSRHVWQKKSRKANAYCQPKTEVYIPQTTCRKKTYFSALVYDTLFFSFITQLLLFFFVRRIIALGIEHPIRDQ